MRPKLFRIEYPCSVQSADSNSLSDSDIAGLSQNWLPGESQSNHGRCLYGLQVSSSSITELLVRGAFVDQYYSHRQ